MQIISLDVVKDTLTSGALDDGQSIDTPVIAIVAHADGNDHIAGGTIRDRDGHTYAAFQSGSTKGTLTANLSWNLIQLVAPINAGKGQSRTFVASFSDSEGRTVEREFTLAFQCRVRTDFARDDFLTGAFDGRCFDNQHCGVEGKACVGGQSCNIVTESCEDPSVSDCIDLAAFPYVTSCDCAPYTCDRQRSRLFDGPSCAGTGHPLEWTCGLAYGYASRKTSSARCRCLPH